MKATNLHYLIDGVIRDKLCGRTLITKNIWKQRCFWKLDFIVLCHQINTGMPKCFWFYFSTFFKLSISGSWSSTYQKTSKRSNHQHLCCWQLSFGNKTDEQSTLIVSHSLEKSTDLISLLSECPAVKLLLPFHLCGSLE